MERSTFFCSMQFLAKKIHNCVC